MKDKKILEAAEHVGITSSETQRSCSFFHVDHKTMLSHVNKAYEGKVEVLDILDAIKKYDWLKDYMWKLVDKNKDEYTKKAQKPSGGYFMRILKGAKVDLPLESCLMMTQDIEQCVHNVIIAEEGSEARIITGCSLTPEVKKGTHIGVSEFFIKKNAFLHFTMIHRWAKESKVRPRSAALLDENAVFVSNYINLHPVKDMQMYPAAICRGKNSKTVFNSIILATEDSLYDVGSKVVFEGENTKGEISSRVVAEDNATAIARGMLESKNCPIKGHLECRGLILNDDATIHAIPELIGNKKDIDLSHEAAVGKIADKEIEYLMARGLSKDKAVSVIVRGFLSVNFEGLPERLSNAIQEMVDKTVEGM